MSCYVFRVLTTKKGKPRKRKTWVRNLEGPVGDIHPTCEFSHARIFDEKHVWSIVEYALEWEKDLGCRIVPVEICECVDGVALLDMGRSEWIAL